MPVCPACGRSTPEGKSCESCGAALSAPPIMPASQGPPAAPPSAPEGVKKKKIVLIAVFVIIAAIIAAFVFGITSVSPPNPIHTVALSSPLTEGWTGRPVPGTTVTAYSPNGWTISKIRASELDAQYIKHDAISALSPDGTTGLEFFNLDVSSLVGSTAYASDAIKTGYISNAFYDSMVSGLTSTDMPTNIVKNPTYYTINGNPSREIEWDLGSDHVQVYFTVTGVNTCIISMLQTTAASQSQYINQGKNALVSLTDAATAT